MTFSISLTQNHRYYYSCHSTGNSHKRRLYRNDQVYIFEHVEEGDESEVDTDNNDSHNNRTRRGSTGKSADICPILEKAGEHGDPERWRLLSGSFSPVVHPGVLYGDPEGE